MTEEIPPEELKKIPPEAAKEEAKGGVTTDSAGELEDLGIAEAKQLSRGKSLTDLEKEAKESEHGRTERFKDQFETITMLAMWGISIATAIFGFTWFWHLMTPESWHWLLPEQVEKIQNIFAGVILAGVLGDHFKKRLS